MKVEILLCNNKNWFMYTLSSIIRWAQGVPYSHMAILFSDMPLQLKGKEFSHVVMDATLRGGVKLSTKADFDKKHVLVRKKEIYVDTTPEMMKVFISKHVGKKYGWTSFIDFGLKKLGLSKSPRFGANEKMLVCSEVIAEFLRYFNLVEIPKDIDSCDLMVVDELLSKI